jgi:hypothetical protein
LRKLNSTRNLFPADSSFLPSTELDTVTVERLFIQIEYTGIAAAVAAFIVARTDRRLGRKIVFGSKIGHIE